MSPIIKNNTQGIPKGCHTTQKPTHRLTKNPEKVIKRKQKPNKKYNCMKPVHNIILNPPLVSNTQPLCNTLKTTPTKQPPNPTIRSNPITILDTPTKPNTLEPEDYNDYLSDDFPILPTSRSDHPLDKAISPTDISIIQHTCQLPRTDPLRDISLRPIGYLTPANIISLLSHGTATNDEVIHQYLSVLRTFSDDVSFVDTNFSRDLKEKRWPYAYQKYFDTPTHCHRQRTTLKPSLASSPIILIPIHINEFHWVALACRRINNKILFLYSDDLNNDNTESIVKEQYSTFFTDSDFHPHDALWMNCHSSTYIEHSNECGLRTLLALTMMALHPEPHQNMLLPLMHHNLAQISRTWVAKTILTQKFDVLPFQSYLLISQYEDNRSSNSARSIPAYLFNLFHQQAPSQQNTNVSLDLTLHTQSTQHHINNSPSRNITNNFVTSTQRCEEPTNTTLPLTASASTPHPKNETSTQRTLLEWAQHRPFITNVHTQPWTHHTEPTNPRESYSIHLTPFGTGLPVIDKTKVLRIVMQNTQHSFNIHGDKVELHQLMLNLQSIGAGAFVAISPNVNWCNTSHWATTKNIFRKPFNQVHLSAVSCDIGYEKKYLHYPTLVGGNAILTFNLWASKVTNTYQDPRGHGTYTTTTLQGKK